MFIVLGAGSKINGCGKYFTRMGMNRGGTPQRYYPEINYDLNCTNSSAVGSLESENIDYNDDKFHHYVFQFDNSKNPKELTLYVDGVKKIDAVKAYHGNDIDYSRIEIGRESQGWYSDIFLYSKLLSNSEVNQLYQQHANEIV